MSTSVRVYHLSRPEGAQQTGREALCDPLITRPIGIAHCKFFTLDYVVAMYEDRVLAKQEVCPECRELFALYLQIQQNHTARTWVKGTLENEASDVRFYLDRRMAHTIKEEWQ